MVVLARAPASGLARVSTNTVAKAEPKKADSTTSADKTRKRPKTGGGGWCSSPWICTNPDSLKAVQKAAPVQELVTPPAGAAELNPHGYHCDACTALHSEGYRTKLAGCRHESKAHSDKDLCSKCYAKYSEAPGAWAQLPVVFRKGMPEFVAAEWRRVEI